MKKILLLILVCPLFSSAQKIAPKYEHDTLYTSSGYKIYKGQTLQIGSPTSESGRFRYINIKSDTKTKSLVNRAVTVIKMKNYGISVLGNGYIEIIGTIIFNDGSKGYVDLHIAFDKAIGGSPGEIIVPEEFRDK